MTKPQVPNLKCPISRCACLLFLTSLLALSPARAQTSPPDHRFGAIEAFRDPVAAAEAGVGWERILFYWSELQPNGPNDWNGYHVPDEWLNQAAAAGREVMVILKHTPAWATDGPVGCGVPRGLDLPVDDPSNVWAAFVRRVVGTYTGRIDRWVIWNEPDIAPDTYGAEWCGSTEEYYQLLKVAYLVAHQANPNVIIHLAGLTRWHDPTYLQQFLAVATQDPTGAEHGYYFDVVSLHIYFQSETVPQIIGETRAALVASGLQKPIWVNETNAAANYDPPYWSLPEANFNITLEEQASFLLQSFALALTAGAERIAVYKWVDSEPQPGVEPFGLIRLDYSRRPAYDAYRLITAHYAGAVSAKVNQQPLFSVVTLERGNLTTRVCWTRTETDATVELTAWASQARLIEQTGAEQVVEPVDGHYTLLLPGARCADKRGCIIGGPTYLLVEGTGAAPPLEETTTPTPTGTLTATPPTDTPTPPPTYTLTLTPTHTPILTPTHTPTLTPTDTPTSIPTHTPISTPTYTPVPSPTSIPVHTPTPAPTSPPTPSPLPTPTLWPSAPATRNPPVWPMLIGLAAAVLFAAVVGTLFRRQHG
jgi:hypothetical protein